jgi:hypothetical protein
MSVVSEVDACLGWGENSSAAELEIEVVLTALCYECLRLI